MGCHSYTNVTDEKNGYNAGPGNKSQILFRLFPMCTNITAGTKIKINYGSALSPSFNYVMFYTMVAAIRGVGSPDDDIILGGCLVLSGLV